jgi:hypothetical protein
VAFFVTDFVAVHSCEGSGGIAPLFPLASSASWLSRQRCKSAERFCNFSPVKQFEFQQVESVYEAEIVGMG